MRDVMSGHVERGVPGLVTLVSRRGETFVEALGMKMAGGPGVAGNGPMRRDTIFRIASMSKPITAAAAMILVEECKLRLDDPVDRLLPELANRRVLRRLDGPLEDTVPARRPITLRDLLTFRLGFGMIMAPPDSTPFLKALGERGLAAGPPAPATTPAPDEWMRRLGTLPLMHQPGERWLYHTGSEVLGVLIARASGRPFEAFLRARLFEPLGMEDTGFSVPAHKLDRFAASYWTDPGTRALGLYDAADGQWSRPPAFPSGGGGLVSTVDDFLAFSQMLLNGGKHGHERILSRLSVEAMTADQLTRAQKAASDDLSDGFFDSHGWGFGMAVATRRDSVSTVPGQYGWDGGLGTSWRGDPKEEMVGILMTQRAWESPTPPPVTADFWTSAYQAIDD
jgi:CubicO group peptidase (beta-lactamase class C family)